MEIKVITDTKIEGDVIFDGQVVFENNIEITGHLRVKKNEAKKSIHVHKSYVVEMGDIVGGSQKVGEYQNASMKVIDTTKIKTNRIVFTSSSYHERNFWLAQLEPIHGIGELKDALKDEDSCWDNLIEIAKEYKPVLLAYEHFVPAVRQALELFLK